MSSTWHLNGHDDGGAVDVLLRYLVREDDDPLARSLGEWLRAYQRVTHYFRALDVWSPPPHLLAWAVLERAMRRTAGAHGVAPTRLAMDEVQAMLREQGAAILGAGRFKPVPKVAPAPMLPQSLEGSAFTRALNELTDRIRHFGVVRRWRRRHA